ncbi:MAG: VWA domain-containing protein, partial [Bacilli bacterium]|nr:VWA domain-containing protein [Bacilli bacterium]
MIKGIRKLDTKYIIYPILVMGFLLILVGSLLNSYAVLEPVKSIVFKSTKLNYEEREPGSWMLEKSAEWISKEKATITFEVSTIGKNKTQYSDIIIVMDNSVSMSGYKQERAKSDVIEFIGKPIGTLNDRVRLIAFNSTATEISLGNIKNLMFQGQSSYYQALKGVENYVLKRYQPSENRNCMILFLTGSYPNLDTPSEVGYFSYLKEEYPYITINAIQYGMG